MKLRVNKKWNRRTVATILLVAVSVVLFSVSGESSTSLSTAFAAVNSHAAVGSEESPALSIRAHDSQVDVSVSSDTSIAVRVYFEQASSNLSNGNHPHDPKSAIRQSNLPLKDFVKAMSQILSDTTFTLVGIDIQSSCSPEGTLQKNIILGNERAFVLDSCLKANFNIPEGLIHILSAGPNWSGFEEMMEEWRDSIPEYEEAIAIIRRNPMPAEAISTLSSASVLASKQIGKQAQNQQAQQAQNQQNKQADSQQNHQNNDLQNQQPGQQINYQGNLQLFKAIRAIENVHNTRLMEFDTLNSRTTWDWLNENFCYMLRYSDVQVRFKAVEGADITTLLPVIEPDTTLMADSIAKAKADSIAIANAIADSIAKAKADSIANATPDTTAANLLQTTVRKDIDNNILAIKTNLLFDVATLINIGVEVPIGNRWSVVGEYYFPWWKIASKNITIQCIAGMVEGRFWFGKRETMQRLTGFHAGVYAGAGYYDFQLGGDGIQGELFLLGGLSGGYSHTIGKYLRLDYSLGVGYLRTDYRPYKPATSSEYGDIKARIYPWSQRRQTWIGPTQAQVSLVWMLDRELFKKKNKPSE